MASSKRLQGHFMPFWRHFPGIPNALSPSGKAPGVTDPANGSQTELS
jgi:hypothetical protein